MYDEALSSRFTPSIGSAAVAVSLLLFVVMGCAFISRIGFEDDEALIVSGAFAPDGMAQSLPIFGRHIPLMVMSYVGALKSWMYAPVFWLWQPSAASLRVPVILIGGLTIWLFYRLVSRIAGQRAAIAACVLLSADTTFFLTTCFDWGPVVLQHLLVVSGVLCLLRFHREKRLRFLAAGCFLFGLGLWDKALFAWILTAMAIASLVVFPDKLRMYLRLRNVAVAAAAFGVGAAPLIVYNISFPLDTLRSNASYSTGQLPEKVRNLASALSGQALFGFLVRNDPAGHPRKPETPVERLSVWIADTTGRPKSGFLGFALLAALLLTPVLWLTPARRLLLFSLIAMLAAWLQMLFTKGAGNAAHHLILLWPFPVLSVAVAFAQVSCMLGRIGKPLLAAVILFLAATSALVTNEYFASIARNGGGIVWTDAINPLSDCLNRIQSKTIYVNDWGIIDILRMLNRDKLPLVVGSDPLSKERLDPEDRRLVLARISEAGAVHVSHTDETELFKGVNKNLQDLAVEAGYRRETLAEIADRNGRTIFEVFRFSRK